MITLITAVPGSGKTLLAVTLIEDALASGRLVFTNIDGLVTEKFTNSHLLAPAPDDWRDAPEGSLVVYDEAQQPHLYPSNAKAGRVEDERLTAMETHRHTGHDLIFITQHPTFVHHHIRKLVGRHIHLYRGRGIGGAARYEWSHVCNEPNDRKEQSRADSKFWKFPKEFFDYYHSATAHTHRFSLPGKFIVFALIMAGVIMWLIWRFAFVGLASFSADSVALESGQPVVPLPTVQVVGSFSAERVTTQLGGCIWTEHYCSCVDTQGYTLSLGKAQCLSLVSSPLPRVVELGASRKSES